jgi:multidrug efflux pump subunit AcrA (membrane-fusion protein)
VSHLQKLAVLAGINPAGQWTARRLWQERKCLNFSSAPPAMKVKVVKAEQSDVPLTGEWVGTLDGYVNAQIQPQANGYLIRQDYREGIAGREGSDLFEIDPRPFEAALEQAQGTLGQAQAQLALAEINVNRDTPSGRRACHRQEASSTTILSRRRKQRPQ